MCWRKQRSQPRPLRGAALAPCGVVQWLTNSLGTVTLVPLESIGLGLLHAIDASFGLV